MTEFSLKDEDITRDVINKEMVFEIGDFVVMAINRSETEYGFLCSLHYAEEIPKNQFHKMVDRTYFHFKNSMPQNDIVILLRQDNEETLQNEAMGIV